ncbi:MAG: family 10 glycosylhydrolase [Oscillospiraceae bacterium]|nr:family 10 glycosylhydrolase [Oscillospiraceae bacterium]MDY6209136.1 family 10 glycosylhydrolase [Oscillospiraceae bacterium]
MKKILRSVTAAITAAALICGCTQITDELPDSYYETDVISETEAPPLTFYTEPIVSKVPETSSISLSSAETVSFSESQSETEAISPVSETNTTIPAETETETETSSETASETVFVPGTLPPETTSSVSAATAPSITIVTIPTLPETTESTSAESVSSSAESYYPQSGYYPLNFDRQKAVWVSYLEYDRIMRGSDETQFTKALNACFDNIAALGCNTVYFQVRVYGDAYYRSSLFPKGDRLTGDYDPLEIAVKSAHDRGLSIHAWINPMRLMTDSQMKSYPDSYKIGQWYNDPAVNGKYIVNSSGRWYLNPAYAETVSLICDGISEIVTAYNVDGIQIDDYFYPTTDPSFDSAAYAASGTSLSLADWRRDNVTKMVKKMYEAVHSANPKALFGISPQGNTDNNYNDLYADIYTWVSTPGCCDYICPQIYFGFDNSALPYAETVDKWAGLVTSPDVKLVIGLAAYKSGTEDKYAGSGSSEWINSTDILARQRELTDIYNAGYAFFRYDSLFLPDPAVAASVNAELDNLRK